MPGARADVSASLSSPSDPPVEEAGRRRRGAVVVRKVDRFPQTGDSLATAATHRLAA